MEEYDEGRGGLWRRGIEDEGIVMDDGGGGDCGRG